MDLDFDITYFDVGALTSRNHTNNKENDQNLYKSVKSQYTTLYSIYLLLWEKHTFFLLCKLYTLQFPNCLADKW